MKSSGWLRQMQILLALGMMLALAACAAGGTGSNTGSQGYAPPVDTPTPTPTTAAPTPTPTLTPPVCNSNFNPAYVSTLPDADSPETHIFAQVQLPPLTRSFDNDASGGFRGREMCSGGTTQSVTDFMTQHLAQLGWQMQGSVDTCTTVIPNYATSQCWKNGSYLLFVGINTNLDWVISFRDPNFM